LALSVRIIPCLDVKDGRVVKGVQFQGLKDIGDPVELAIKYYESGADEITFLDVSASLEGRKAMLDVISRTAEAIFIPLTVGGGVRKIEDVASYLDAGADKVSIGTAAISNPELIEEISKKYGDQIVVVSLDIVEDPDAASGYSLTTYGGTQRTGVDALAWISVNQDKGIGELLVNSVDADGTKSGFNNELISAIRKVTSLPLIASGGAGVAADFLPAVQAGANAVLAASIFHSGAVSIQSVKQELSSNGVKVRM
jgi:imidazole glycerol-phosphate synthase subunit HisF